MNEINIPTVHDLDGCNGKAKVFEYRSDERCVTFLVSYTTIICATINGTLYAVHEPPSNTAWKHLAAYCQFLDIPKIDRKAFGKLPIATEG